MNWMRWSLVLLVTVLSLAAWQGWQNVRALRAENAALKAELQTLQQQQQSTLESREQTRAKELERLRAEAEEVHKLRNEVRQLRTGVSEVEKLRSENQQLKKATVAPRPASSAPSTNAPKDQFPRDAWTHAGYATPEAALVSSIWSMLEGNPTRYLESLAPEEQERMARSWQNKSEAEIAAKHQQDVAAITGLRILEQQTVSPAEMQMKVYLEGAGRVETVVMKQVGQEWKFGGFVRTAR